MIDRCVVINLARRPDRYAQFLKNLPDDWPFGEVERFDAIDGHRLPTPSWWKVGKGAWGAQRSHERVLERAVLNQETTLVLEDDAVFVDGFTAKAQTFLKRVPRDWQMLYLGGQHIRDKPKVVPGVAGVLRCHNVNRLHAYVVRSGYAGAAYRWITDYKNYEERQHIDHRWGAMHAACNVYAPVDWLVGQGDGKSDIKNGGPLPTRYWEHGIRSDEMAPFVAVMGPWGGGTSVVAGILHHLGVWMGEEFFHLRPGAAKQPNTFEEKELKAIAMASYTIPGCELKKDPEEALRSWGQKLRREARKKSRRWVGGKHPGLRDAVPQMKKALDPVRWVRVCRPEKDIQKTFRKREWWGVAEQEGWVKEYNRKLDGFLADEDVVKVDYPWLLQHPDRAIRKLADDLGMVVSPSQQREAERFVIR